jgi:hypothetical protein
MPASQFEDPIFLQPGGNLLVKGPFDPQGQILGKATIRFLIMQELPGRQPVVFEGEATWEPTQGDSWEMEIPKSDLRGLQVGRARGIGLGVVVKDANLVKDSDPPEYKKIDPPAFETVTWCATTHIAEPSTASGS